MVVEARYAVFSIDQYITFEPTWAIFHIRPHFRDLSTQIFSTQKLSTFRYGPENSGVRLSHDRPMMKNIYYMICTMFGASAAMSEVQMRLLLAVCTQILPKFEYFFVYFIFRTKYLESLSYDRLETFIKDGTNTKLCSVEI